MGATPQLQVPAAADADAAHPQTANATEQARLDLEAVVAAAAMTSNGGGGAANLRGTAGWGHGIFGETCCMCSQHFGFTTVLYAAEDYSHFFGGHAANWWCQQECEVKCHSGLVGTCSVATTSSTCWSWTGCMGTGRATRSCTTGTSATSAEDPGCPQRCQPALRRSHALGAGVKGAAVGISSHFFTGFHVL